MKGGFIMSMEEAKTVSSDVDLFVNQCSDTDDMRSTLLSFNRSDPNAARKALQNITILRVYHQVSRIVRYTSIMDKLEDKMYQSIGSQIDNSDPDDPDTWRTLLTLQTRLQENMIQSHKLLEPYLNFESLNFTEIAPEPNIVEADAMILDRDSREKLRNSAQQVLQALQQNAQVEQQAKKEEIKEIKNESMYQINNKSKFRSEANGLYPLCL